METKIKQNKSFKEWLTEDVRKDMRLWRGMVIGLATGYVVSYIFQSEFVRVKLGFFGYISNFFDILFSFGDKTSAQIALTAWIPTLLGGIIGGWIEKRLIEKGKIQGWTRKKQSE